MKTFKMKLPGGWYPTVYEDCIKDIQKMVQKYQVSLKNNVAGIVPHAGWDFSGHIAAKVIKTLAENNPKPDIVCLLGGHLASYHPVLFLDYDEAETPLGNIEINRDLTHKILAPIAEKVDDPNEGDNTIEVILPFVKFFYPNIPLIGFRSPVSDQAEILGKRISFIAKEENLNILVIGSADLTHYGPNYGFMPKGVGVEAIKWVKDINDKELIDTVIQGEIQKVLDHCKEKKSSCSGGAIATTMAFSKGQSKISAELVQYATSNDVYQSNSFVGYAGIVF